MRYHCLVDFEPFFPHQHAPGVLPVAPTETFVDLDCRKTLSHHPSTQHTYTTHQMHTTINCHSKTIHNEGVNE